MVKKRESSATTQVARRPPPRTAERPSYAACDRELLHRALEGAQCVRLTCGPHELNRSRVDSMLSNPILGEIYEGRYDGSQVELVVDLRDCLFLDPYGITVCQALCAGIYDKVARIWVYLPKNAGVHAYCGVCGLIAGLRPVATLVGEHGFDFRPTEDSDVLVPLREISQEVDVQRALELAEGRLNRLLRAIRWPSVLAERSVMSIMEIAMNVLEHAGAKGYLTLQAYRLRTPRPFLVISMSDAGVGIRNTLARRYPRFRRSDIGDDQVLMELFRRSLTSRRDQGQGKGMATLQTSLDAASGHVFVRSGAGAYVQYSSHAPRALSGVVIPGTHVRLSPEAPRG